jgi:hypothetical protein
VLGTSGCLLLRQPSLKATLMPYVYADVDDLEQTDKVGTKQCVVLVQHYAKAPVTRLWTEGARVLGTHTIQKGTAIATFVDGKYANGTTGNHAGLYISQDAGGIWIMDQWSSDTGKPKVSKRYLRKKGQSGNRYVDPSNNADAYSVIE